MTDLRSRIADALRAHRYLKTIHDGGEPQECCTCPWTGPRHESHLADVLASLPGIAEEQQ